MTAKEEAIVRRAFDRAIEIAKAGDYTDADESDADVLHYRLCAFFGSMSYSAGCPEVGLDALRPQSSAEAKS